MVFKKCLFIGLTSTTLIGFGDMINCGILRGSALGKDFSSSCLIPSEPASDTKDWNFITFLEMRAKVTSESTKFCGSNG